VAGGNGRPVNVGTANVGVANISRVQMTRSDPNTGESKTGESVILTDIEAALGKIDQTLIVHLDNLNETLVKEFRRMGTGGRTRPDPAPVTNQQRLQQEKQENRRSSSTDEILRKISNHLDTLTKLTELNRLGDTGTQKVKNPGGANFDNAQDRLRRLDQQHKALRKLTDDFLDNVNTLKEKFNAGTIGLGAFVAQLTTTNALFVVQRVRMNSLNKTTNRLVNSFNSLTSGVDGFELVLQYIKSRYNADGGYKTMIQSGTGGLYESFIDDILPNITRDSLYQTSLGVRRSNKNDSGNELLTGGRTLDEAGRQMYQARKGVSDKGFSLMDRMNFNESNDTLMDIAGTLKRAGMIDNINDARSTDMMAKQLKAMLVAASNTGATVEEVRKNTTELRKKTGDYASTGRLNSEQMTAANEMGSLWHNNKGMMDLLGTITEHAGNGALWASENKDQIKSMQLLGIDIGEAMRLVDNFGKMDPKEQAAQWQALMKSGTNRAPRAVLQNEKVDQRGWVSGANQLGNRGPGADPNETTFEGMMNRVGNFFKTTFSLDTMKALGGAFLGGAATVGLIASNAALTLAIRKLTIAMGFGGILGKGGIKGALGGIASGASSLASGAGGMIASALGGVGAMGAGLLAKLGLGGGSAAASATATARAAGVAPIVGGSPASAATIAGARPAGGRMAGALKVGGAAALGGLAVAGADMLTPEFKGKSTMMSGLNGALTGAAIGAIAGPVGAMIGAAVGGLGGMIAANIGSDADAGSSPAQTSVARPPAHGWNHVTASLNSGFDRSVSASETLLTAIQTSNSYLDGIKQALDKGAGIVRTTVSQATLPPMQPGVKMF